MNGKLVQDWEKEFIIANYLILSDEQISQHLNRSSCTIQVLRSKLGCLKQTAGSPFTTYEKNFILNNYQSMNNIEIGNILGRSNASISSFLNKKRLSRIIRRKQTNSVYITNMVTRMKLLISLCETTQSQYKLDLYKQELKKLSGL